MGLYFAMRCTSEILLDVQDHRARVLAYIVNGHCLLQRDAVLGAQDIFRVFP